MSEGAYRIIPCGDDALRILCGAGDIRYQIAHRLGSFEAWPEIIPGKSDLTVAFDPHMETMDAATDRVRAALLAGVGVSTHVPRRIELEARFGGGEGPDLAAMAERLGESETRLIEAIEASRLQVDMLGFTPGFAYLAGLGPALISERLRHPRARVAAGSIGLITGQIGLYALDGPGGWPIIGRVTTSLFNRLDADPFLLRPGDEVVILRSAAV